MPRSARTAVRRFGLLKDKILSFLGKKKEPVYRRFRDPLGNFEIFYPAGWKYDQDMAVVDGKYSICFEGRESHFTISVDASLPEGFSFAAHAKKELESPSAGIIADVVKGRFHGMPAYSREFHYDSGGKTYFGGGQMFFTGSIVFSLSWSAPERKKEEFEKIFGHMLGSLSVRYGLIIKSKKEFQP
jgi:hypothetical protein